MLERKARWAMWSLGSIANRVILEMRQSDKLEVAAICSSKMEKAQAFIDKYELKKAVPYDNIDEILKRDDIDIVYIASPPELHKKQCCQCLNAGKAVLCEKPMTLNVQDAIDIFACAKKNHVFAAEGVWTNYFPSMKKAMEWIREGRIGEPVEVITTFGFPVLTELANPDDPPHGWGEKISDGGGSLSQFGCYNVNLAQQVFKDEPENIFGACEREPGEDTIDKNTEFIMTYKNHAKRAMISCSMTSRTMDESIISGTGGHIIIGHPFFSPMYIKYYKSVSSVWYNDFIEEWRDPYEAEGLEGFKYQFDAISQYLMDGKTESCEVSWDYSIKLARTMERIRKTLQLI
ncbi:MAG: Gfo/Idh/MocA family oxidoreductase [Bacteroides thetaiotaomicron]|nr:Gfo/Idh/MocA family oxidoreductase [Bacteroides thetaiotaomicron]